MGVTIIKFQLVFQLVGKLLMEQGSLSPDGTKVIFGAVNNSKMYIYTCNINGSNLTKIVDDGLPSQYYSLEGVY